jgi:hypothetical protein
MLPTPSRLTEVANLSSGNLREVPFAALLCALAVARKTIVLELRRGRVEKRVFIEEGVPIDCRSNIATETLGRFMMSQGKLREEDFTAMLSRSASLGLPLGQVLLQQELVTAYELFRILQQNLARKLLDLFTWRDGEFSVSHDVPPAESTLKVKAPQLIITGVMKFAPQTDVDAAIVPLIGKKLALHPAPPIDLAEIRLGSEQGRITERLAKRSRIDEIAASTEIPYEEVSRLLYALTILGIVVPEDQLPKGTVAATPPPPPTTPVTRSTKPAAALTADDEILRNDLMQAYLAHRGKDSFDLFNLAETATEEEIRRAFFDYSRRCAPWRFEAGQFEALRDKAEELYLEAARAYAELASNESRMALLNRRRTLRENQKRETTANRFAIKTDLLDPELQYRKGKTLLDAGRTKEALTFLEFAADCDAQNSTYGAELAWCRFLNSPASSAAASMASLRDIMRIDPESGLAVYYAGEIARQRGDVREAEPLLRKACKMLAPDRRPVESLKLLLTK